jgi:hypothetical protein
MRILYEISKKLKLDDNDRSTLILSGFLSAIIPKNESYENLKLWTEKLICSSLRVFKKLK